MVNCVSVVCTLYKGVYIQVQLRGVGVHKWINIKVNSICKEYANIPKTRQGKHWGEGVHKGVYTQDKHGRVIRIQSSYTW